MKVHIIGNCQVFPLLEILSYLLPEMLVTASQPVHSMSTDEVKTLHSQISEYDIVLTQPISSGYRDSIGIDTEAITKRLDESRQKLYLYPNIHFEGFHPTWGYLRLEDSSLLRGSIVTSHANPMFNLIQKSDYHDYLLLACLLSDFSVYKTCELLSSSANLDVVSDWFHGSLAMLAQKEANCITSIHNILPRLFAASQSNCPMHSFNHPALVIMICMALQIQAHINGGEQVIDDLLIERSTSLATSSGLKDQLGGIRLPTYPWVINSICQITSLPYDFAIAHSNNLCIDHCLLTIEEMISGYFDYYNAVGLQRLSHNMNSPKGKLANDIVLSLSNFA